jgi:hypothetical protein
VSEADETPLPLSELAKRLPAVRGTKPPHRATLYKWATAGLKSRSGACVRLDTQFVGGTLCSSLSAVQRFSDSLDDVNYEPTVYRNAREARAMQKRSKGGIAKVIANLIAA